MSQSTVGLKCASSFLSTRLVMGEKVCRFAGCCYRRKFIRGSFRSVDSHASATCSVFSVLVDYRVLGQVDLYRK